MCSFLTIRDFQGKFYLVFLSLVINAGFEYTGHHQFSHVVVVKYLQSSLLKISLQYPFSLLADQSSNDMSMKNTSSTSTPITNFILSRNLRDSFE